MLLQTDQTEYARTPLKDRRRTLPARFSVTPLELIPLSPTTDNDPTPPATTAVIASTPTTTNDTTDIVTIRTQGSVVLQSKRATQQFALQSVCAHKASPIYGCTKCAIPPAQGIHEMVIDTSKTPAATSSGFTSSSLLALAKWYPQLMPYFFQGGPKSLSSFFNQPSTEMKVLIRLEDWVVPHNEISVRSDWKGFRIFFPTPTLESLQNTTNVMLAASGMATSAAMMLSVPLLTIAGPLASYLVFQQSLIKSVDQGYGVMLYASWACPFMYVPYALPAPEVEITTVVDSDDDGSESQSVKSETSIDLTSMRRQHRSSWFPGFGFALEDYQDDQGEARPNALPFWPPEFATEPFVGQKTKKRSHKKIFRFKNVAQVQEVPTTTWQDALLRPIPIGLVVGTVASALFLLRRR